MININGVEIPTPSSYNVGIMDLSKAERNVNGDMVIERIATKRKLELGWSYLSKEDLARVLHLVSPVFFTATYIDPQDDGVKIGTFYAGDRNAGAMDYINGKIRWKDVKFNLIER